jgi:GNAT superfamily N-acetyltransferase
MAWLAAIEEPQALVLVAIAGGRVVGYDLAIWRDLEPPFLPKRILRVVSVYLEPAHRGGALAAEIVRASLDWGRREGCVEADCQTLADNRARHLLSRGGFRVALLEMRMGL